MKTKLLLLAWLLAMLNLRPGTALAGPGQALSFTATNQYVNVITPASLVSNYTFSAWAFLREGGNFSTNRVAVLSSTNQLANGALNSVELLVRSSTGSYNDAQYLELGRSGVMNGTPSTNAVPTNQWVHLAVTVNPVKLVNYYINGVAAGSWDASSFELTLGTNLALANNAIGGRKFRGQLDEVQIWSRVLSPAEIQTNMNRAYHGADTNLIAYWHFDGAATNCAPTYPGVSDGTPVTSPVYTNSGIPFAPDATTATTSGIGLTTATLQGTVNPGNLATAAWFQWGTDTNYDHITAINNLSATNARFSVASALAGLTPGQTYHSQLVASNSAGTVTGGDVVWTNLILPPSATTLAATNVGFTNATLKATVNPNGLPTTAWFEWGADTNYGGTLGQTNLNAGTAGVALAAVLAGLSQGQTAHYRVVATNANGQTTGEDMTFTTHNGTNTVTTLADSGAGSLRQTIADSLAGEMIIITTNGTITLTSGELVITNSLIIVGSGATNLSISGNNNSRVVNITSSNAVVVISNVTLCNGQAPNGANNINGGGVYNAGTLTLSACTLSANQAGNVSTENSGGHGGGIYNAGTLTLSACTLSANQAGNGASENSGGHGGGIYNAGTLTLSACTLSANRAGNGAAGSDVGSTGSYNVVGLGGSGLPGGNGGGVFNAGTLMLSACTLSANTAGNGGNGGKGGKFYGGSGIDGSGGNGGNGGGIFNDTNASFATLRSSLFALNAGGTGGISRTVRFAGTAGTDPDLSGAFTSLGHNLVGITGNSTGLINGVNSDLVGIAAAPINALLGPLTNNGGATFTMALLPGSPAIEAGDDTLTGTDQCGAARKSGPHVDIGAYELDVSAPGYSAPSLDNVACTVSNLASGLGTATFSFSVNPNGLNTTAWIDYGVSTNYGGTSGTLYLGCANVSVATNLTLSGLQPGSMLHYHVIAANPAGTTRGADHTFTTTAPGDLNGDGVVSQNEFAQILGNLNGNGVLTESDLNLVLSNYWANSTNTITGLTRVGTNQFTFGLTNSTGLSFTILAATNLTDWTALTNAAPEFLFTDSAATNTGQRFYRLRWP